MPDWQPLVSGTVLRDRYEIESVAGQGGFGATYRVRDRERFGTLCALKELLPTQAENPKVRELFEREARTLLSLRHPGIPALHAFFVDEERYFLVEEFVAGNTLAQELSIKRRFSTPEVIGVLEEVLDILDYLHGRTPAVIHRDIKPANIIRSQAGPLYLVDFGAVKEALVVATLSAESTVIGTSGYTPPEQLRGLVLPASDLYSAGATALHLLSGRPPSEWYDAVHGTWRFAGQLPIPAYLEAILGRLLEDQPVKRFASAREVRDALRAGPSSHAPAATRVTVAPTPSTVPTATPTTATVATMSAPGKARTILPWAIAGVAAVAAVGVWMQGAMRSERPAAPVPVAPPAVVAPPATPQVAPAAPSAPDPAPPPPRAAVDQPPRVPLRERRPLPPIDGPRRPPRAALQQEEAPPPPAAPVGPGRTFPAPVNRVWTVSEAALRSLGWSIDRREPVAGFMVTDSRQIEGDNLPVYAKGMRRRLRVHLKAVDDRQTHVRIEPITFRREAPSTETTDDARVNREIIESVLSAIARGL